VQWFIFFATANYVVLMYFGLKMSDTKVDNRPPFYFVAGMFIAVNMIALIMCILTFRWYKSWRQSASAMHRRIRALTLTNSAPFL